MSEELTYNTFQDVLHNHTKELTLYELTEIKDYDKIYFFGKDSKKIKSNNQSNNYNYDDNDNRYRLVKIDHIAYRYEIKKCLGKGVFGNVILTYDHKENGNVAMKILRNEKRFYRQGNIEIELLKKIKKNDPDNKHNVVHIKEYFQFRQHLCITFELLHLDLYTALKLNKFKGYQFDTVKKIARQILEALNFLKNLNIIHCDLKPENILFKSDDSNDVKIIDFGSACQSSNKIHKYIQSRYYRSPEIILEANYSFPIDMWSYGCIISELYIGKPLFPGHNENEQLVYIMEIIGKPPPCLIYRSKRTKYFYLNGKLKTHDSKGRNRRPNSRHFSKALKTDNKVFIDFISKCLIFEPSERMTPTQALNHKWINNDKTNTTQYL